MLGRRFLGYGLNFGRIRQLQAGLDVLGLMGFFALPLALLIFGLLGILGHLLGLFGDNWDYDLAFDLVDFLPFLWSNCFLRNLL